VHGFDPKTPSIARVYDYFLGGRDNFAADRALAERLIATWPGISVAARQNKGFIDRAVTWVAGQGISQFIDVGCGLPTVPSTHGSARAVVPGARVAYVDNDPIVVSHLNALPARDQAGLTVVDGDVRDTDRILDAVEAGIDLSAPACLIMAALLHFFPVETGQDLVAKYTARLAPGSYVIFTVGLAHGEPAQRFFSLYSQGPARLYAHSTTDFASFFDSMDLVPPGIGFARTWRPGWEVTALTSPRDGEVLVGVGSVTG
jgi:O-methyltransferase involved in polyketide biosynthesis